MYIVKLQLILNKFVSLVSFRLLVGRSLLHVYFRLLLAQSPICFLVDSLADNILGKVLLEIPLDSPSASGTV